MEAPVAHVVEATAPKGGAPFCPGCGNAFLADSLFCRQCGGPRPDFAAAALTREKTAAWVASWSQEGSQPGFKLALGSGSEPFSTPLGAQPGPYGSCGQQRAQHGPSCSGDSSDR